MYIVSFALILAVRYMGKLYDLHLVNDYEHCCNLSEFGYCEKKGDLGRTPAAFEMFNI